MDQRDYFEKLGEYPTLSDASENIAELLKAYDEVARAAAKKLRSGLLLEGKRVQAAKANLDPEMYQEFARKFETVKNLIPNRSLLQAAESKGIVRSSTKNNAVDK